MITQEELNDHLKRSVQNLFGEKYGIFLDIGKIKEIIFHNQDLIEIVLHESNIYIDSLNEKEKGH